MLLATYYAQGYGLNSRYNCSGKWKNERVLHLSCYRNVLDTSRNFTVTENAHLYSYIYDTPGIAIWYILCISSIEYIYIITILYTYLTPLFHVCEGKVAIGNCAL